MLKRLPVLALAVLLAACARQTPAPVVASTPRALTKTAPSAPTALETQSGWDEATQGETPAAPVTTGLKAALLVPLSGAQAELGRRLLDAATLAVFESGNTRAVTLSPYDTGDTPESAAAAARKAVDEGADLILGPVFAPQVRAVQPVAAGRNVPVVAFSNDASVSAPNIYLMGYQPRDQVRRIISFARNRGVDRFALLVPQGAYGDAVVAAAREVTTLTGGQILTIETFAPNIDSMSAAVKRLAAFAPLLPPETGGAAVRQVASPGTFNGLLIPAGGKTLQALADMLPYYNIDATQLRILGTVQWNDTATLAEDILRGGWFPASPTAVHRAFGVRYQESTGKTPAALESLAYDATALAAALADPAAGGLSAGALENPSGFAGVDGIFRFNADHTAERGFAVLEVRDSDFVEIDPAPERFYGAGL
jgi:ABC-type branched-subunit amino acid transport system substrate-binding protein